MRSIDLDALIGDDDEGEQPTIVLRGETWLLPAVMPIEALTVDSNGELLLLLVEEGAAGQRERFLALRPRVSTAVAKVFAAEIGQLYGVSVGESSASADS